MRDKFFLLAFATLAGCASVPHTPTIYYTYDVYQYTLSTPDFIKLQKKLKSANKNPDLRVIPYAAYWNLVEQLEVESFFSVYKYSSISCKIAANGDLSMKKSKQPCTYSYLDKNQSMSLSADNYKKDRVSHSIYLPSASTSPYHISYNSNQDYLILLYTSGTDNLLFIIYQNMLNIPWDQYKNSPQKNNHSSLKL